LTALSFRSASIDAVLALYSLFHIPREQHGDLLKAIANWLRPGGLIAAIMSCSDEPIGYEPDWLGAGHLFWSSHDCPTA